MKTVNILGRNITLRVRTKAKLKGINVGESLSYRFYDGEYLGVGIVFVQPKQDNPTPRECSIVGEHLTGLFGLPVVFILAPGPSYERLRLIDKGVYFVMGEKFAFLPMLLANERMRRSKPAKHLSPVAQYLLLYHLQVESLEGMSARGMAERLPYSYESVTLGLTCLADVGLCEKVSDGARSKIVHLGAKGRELWDNAQPYLIDPVEKRIYCDALKTDVRYPTCGINALAHYSWLNPDRGQMLMMSKRDFKALEANGALHNANEYDGDVLIEVWKYPVIVLKGQPQEWVDRLSLALSLREEKDPRVEGEVERIINETEWKD